MSDHVMQTYARLDVAFERGEGAWLWDTHGNRYLDALTGIAVCGLGHAHPKLAQAIADQAKTLLHTSNLYGIPLQEELADRLCELSGMDRAFFCNSGAEANEAAIKIARKFGHSKGLSQPNILVFEGSFHGRTMATLSATGNRKVHAGFEPLVQGFVRAPYGDMDAVQQLAELNPNICAVLIEPVQGEGGINTLPDGFLKTLRELCDQKEWLLMLDEVQTGICRSGEWFAFQHEGIQPDVLALAKGLGNGFPVGACLTTGPANNVLQPGNHGSTFGGNPLACRAALTVLDVMQEENLAARATALGKHMAEQFQAKLGQLASVVEIRQRGLLVGIQLNQPATDLVNAALKAGLLINVTAGSVIRLLPPLNLTDAEADELIDRICDLVSEYDTQQGANAA